MARYIDADALIKFITDGLNNPDKTKAFGHDAIEILVKIAYAPTTEVVEAKHGRWTLHTDGSGTCSECGTTQKNVWDCDRWQNYCGHCGVWMDRGVTE